MHYACACLDSLLDETDDGDILCATTLSQAIDLCKDWCWTEHGWPNGVAAETSCDGNAVPGDTGAAEYDPGAAVTYNSTLSLYDVDEDFVDLLKSAPDLVNIDSAYLDPVSGGFQFQGVTSGSLADELGFQNGDKVIAVNSRPTTNLSEAMTAYMFEYDSTMFYVTFVRSGSTTTQTYRIR